MSSPYRESLKAEAVGLTWYEWWDDREDEDVRRDDEDWLNEQNNLKYEEESIDDDMSDADNDFDF